MKLRRAAALSPAFILAATAGTYAVHAVGPSLPRDVPTSSSRKATWPARRCRSAG
jgi:hypothetical protein